MLFTMIAWQSNDDVNWLCKLLIIYLWLDLKGLKNEDDDDCEEDVGAAADVDDEGEVKRFKIEVEHFSGFDYRWHFKKETTFERDYISRFCCDYRAPNFC